MTFLSVVFALIVSLAIGIDYALKIAVNALKVWNEIAARRAPKRLAKAESGEELGPEREGRVYRTLPKQLASGTAEERLTTTPARIEHLTCSTIEESPGPIRSLHEHAAACAADAYERCEPLPGERGDVFVFANLEEQLATHLKGDPTMWSTFARLLREEAKLRGLSVVRAGESFLMMRA